MKNFQPSPHASRRGRQPASVQTRGFTLIELMVGLLLGLLAVLAITQVMAWSEGRKRTVSGSSDSQVNGALALFSLQRDLQMAGYGLASRPTALGCPLVGTLTGGTPPSSQAFSATLAPVTITPNATSGMPDTVTILSARKSGSSVPIIVTAMASTYFSVTSSLGVNAGDLMAFVPQTNASVAAWNGTAPCRLFSVTDDGLCTASNTGLWALRVPHTAGAATSWNEGTANADLLASGSAGATSVPNSFLINLGSLAFSAYTVDTNSHSLQVTTRTASAGGVTSSLFPQIVNLQALYGKDTDNDRTVNTYDKVAPTDWTQVLSVRIAIVARSAQYERDAVTTANPLWDLGASNSAVAGAIACHNGSWCLPMKVDYLTEGGDANAWQHYRYRVYDATVPLRNMIWNAAS